MAGIKRLLLLGSVLLIVGAAWLTGRAPDEIVGKRNGWTELSPDVWRSPGSPASYALVSGDRALLIDATRPLGGRSIDAVLLTHHHRDSCEHAQTYLAQRVPVRASKESAAWLTTEGVEKYWKESLPLRNSRTAYLVLPKGLHGVDCTFEDGQTIDWRGWSIRVVATPGHSRDHLSFLAQKGKDGPKLLFCGDAFTSPGKMWSPYTTDWDHWTNAGLKPTAESLRKMAALKPDVLLPAHGDVVKTGAVEALAKTAEVVENNSFLKSFERFTKERLKDAPQYKFLAKEQAESNGSKPWTQISDHLYLTGNTYVLVSKDDNAYLVVDPWDPHSAKQLPKLKEDRKLGVMEVVFFSHAHYDHYDGIYSILERDKPKVWTLDHVAEPLAEPGKYRAPFLDPRPVKFDKRIKDGETVAWREYKFKFHYFPGQTDFTMAVETVIDGKRCWFTADNFFHQDQFSGTGGWMGLNRSSPLLYEYSAKKLLNAAPEWVLAEHGGAFEFSAEDFRRRAEWGKVSAKAADDLCVSGDHKRDWNPHRIRVEPVLQKAKARDTLKCTLVVDNPLAEKETLAITLQGRGVFEDQTWALTVDGKGTARKPFTLRLPDSLKAGRHVFVIRALNGDVQDGSDAFLAVDVE